MAPGRGLSVTPAAYGRRMVRTCGVCGETKDVEEFNWRRKERDQRDNMCRSCRAAYKQAHYAANRQRYVDNAMARRRRIGEERMAMIIEHLRSHPCVDCGEDDVLVLEFDHLGDKLFSIARGFRDRSLQALLDEMAKCEVVCANCHRRRTAARGGFLRAAVAQWQSHALPRR
jgi:hypothetical protein